MSQDLDYSAMAKKLPTGKTPEQKALRDTMFKQFDPNGNGFLSLAEIDKGVLEVLGLESLYHCKPAIMRAYQAAKGLYAGKGGKKGAHDDDFVSRIEFRILLVYLKEYFELYHIFKSIDTGERGIPIDDPAAAFREIDTDHGGQILFIEFADWALKKHVLANHMEDE